MTFIFDLENMPLEDYHYSDMSSSTSGNFAKE